MIRTLAFLGMLLAGTFRRTGRETVTSTLFCTVGTIHVEEMFAISSWTAGTVDEEAMSPTSVWAVGTVDEEAMSLISVWVVGFSFPLAAA